MEPRGQKSEIKVLVVDDDRKLCRLLAQYLEPMGYLVTSVHNGAEGLEQARGGSFHAVILDVMLPGMDGFEVLAALRKESDAPVIMLTARGEETDRVVGLEMGADDYLPKPFSTRELLARLRAVTRRYELGAAQKKERREGVVSVGALQMDPGSRVATMDGAPLPLTSIEFDLCYSLAKAAGRVLTRDQILDDVAGREYEVFDRSIDVHISSIRRKLGDDPKRPRFIRTVRGTGYMLMRPADENR